MPEHESRPGPAGNLLGCLPTHAAGETFEPLWAGAGARIERIVSHGHASPDGFWYDQDEDEWVVLVRGEATLAFSDGTSRPLVEGDWIVIPAGCRHRVETVSDDAVWLAAHLAPARVP